MWLAVMKMMMMVEVMYNLANSWEEKALKVRLEMLSMADRKFKTNLQIQDQEVTDITSNCVFCKNPTNLKYILQSFIFPWSL